MKNTDTFIPEAYKSIAIHGDLHTFPPEVYKSIAIHGDLHTFIPEGKKAPDRRFYLILANISKLHIWVVWSTSTFWCNPSNVLTWVFNVTSFTVNTVL